MVDEKIGSEIYERLMAVARDPDTAKVITDQLDVQELINFCLSDPRKSAKVPFCQLKYWQDRFRQEFPGLRTLFNGNRFRSKPKLLRAYWALLEIRDWILERKSDVVSIPPQYEDALRGHYQDLINVHLPEIDLRFLEIYLALLTPTKQAFTKQLDFLREIYADFFAIFFETIVGSVSNEELDHLNAILALAAVEGWKGSETKLKQLGKIVNEVFLPYEDFVAQHVVKLIEKMEDGAPWRRKRLIKLLLD